MTPSALGVAVLVLSVASAITGQDTTSTPAPQPCDEKGWKGWFGPECRYRCRCQSDQADSCDPNTGTCSIGQGGLRCAEGWFGPACQYAVSPIATNAKTPAWLDDNDLFGTCNDLTGNFIYFTLKTPHRFSWLRATISTTETFKTPVLTLYRNSSIIECQKKAVFYFDANRQIFDIVCPTNVSITGVQITGDVVRSLCSVRVSAGRNVALKQNTTQSSTFWSSDQAVDGHVAGSKLERVCSATLKESNHATFALSLKTPTLVEQIVIYGTGSAASLTGFTLQLYGHNDSLLHTYVDRTQDTQAHQYVIVPRPGITRPVTDITVTSGQKNVSLVICEIEVYGDSVCPAGEHGSECEHTCNCAAREDVCHSGLGVCHSGCAHGFTGERCSHRCPKHTHSLGCSNSCPAECAGRLCHHVTGKCFRCAEGFENCLRPKAENALNSDAKEDANFLDLMIGSGVFGVVCVSVFLLLLARKQSERRDSLALGSGDITGSVPGMPSVTFQRRYSLNPPPTTESMRHFVESNLSREYSHGAVSAEKFKESSVDNRLLNPPKVAFSTERSTISQLSQDSDRLPQ